MSAHADTRPPLLEATGVVKRFGGFVALDGVDLCVRTGSVHALIGTNGAGKTTLLELIAGRLTPDAGQIAFGGRDISKLSVWQRTRLGIGRSFQVAGVFNSMTVRENLEVAAAAAIRRDLVRMFRRTSAAEGERVAAALAATDLEALSDQLAANLSQGDRKRLEIAIVLALEPTILALDEPTAGMSPAETLAVAELLESLVQRHGLTLLIIEHDMEVVFRLADVITVLNQGRLVFEGTPAQVADNEEVRRIYLGSPAGPGTTEPSEGRAR